VAVITRWPCERGGRKAGFHCIGVFHKLSFLYIFYFFYDSLQACNHGDAAFQCDRYVTRDKSLNSDNMRVTVLQVLKLLQKLEKKSTTTNGNVLRQKCCAD